jgi:prevent-host-death family protein
MERFTVTRLNRTPGQILDAAYRGPVELTERGKRKFVILAADHYDRLKGESGQKHHHVDDLSEEERAYFAAGLAEPDDAGP